MEEKQNSNVLLDIVVSLRKHILGMIIIFIIVMLVVVVTTFRITPIYEVESSVLVKYGREYIYRSVEEQKKGDVSPLINYNYSTIINTELEIFNSSELAEEVVNSLGVEKLFPNFVQNDQEKEVPLSLAVQSFRGMLNASHIKGSNVIRVAFQHQDPNIAVQAVSDLIERFKDRHLEIYKNPEVSFLEQQVARYGKELQEAEEAKRSYKQKHDIFALNEQRVMHIKQYLDFKSLLIGENSILDALLEKQISLEKQLETVPEVVVHYEDSSQGEGGGATGSKLLQLRLHEHALLEKYPENNRLVTAVRQEIEMVENFIGNPGVSQPRNVRSGRNTLYLQLENQLLEVETSYESKQKRVESISVQAKQLKVELQKLSEHEIDIKRLNDKIKAVGSNYQNFRDNLDKSRIQEIMDSEKLVNVVVIDKPRVPLKPIKPNKKLRILVGLILSVACSFFYVLVVENTFAPKK